jgi:cobalt-zinc-cadmium efflux system outer membrane protein
LSEYELRRLRVERARYEIDLSAATLVLRAARRTLTALILPDGTRELAPLELPDAEPRGVPLEDVLNAARVNRPELVAAASWTAAARGARRAAGAERLPLPTLTAGYKDQSDGASGAFLGVAFPLPLFNRNGAAVAARDAAVSSAEARQVLVARQVHDDVRRAHDAYVAARESANLMRSDLVGDTDALLRIARVAYEEGEMTLVELFDAVDAFRVAHVIATEAIADLWVGYYDLERAVGAQLEALSTGEVR